MINRSECIQFVQDNAREATEHDTDSSIKVVLKGVYEDPEENKEWIDMFVNQGGPNLVIFENGGGKNQWNTGNCVDDELFALMAADIAMPTITPTSKVTMWILCQSNDFSRSVFRTLVHFPHHLLNFLHLMITHFPKFSDTSGTFMRPDTTYSPKLSVEILHRCIFPRKKAFFQALFDCNIFIDLDYNNIDTVTLFLILIIYSHAEGFDLRVDKRMSDMASKWIHAVGRVPVTDQAHPVQWLHYAIRNTSISKVMSNRAMKKLKRSIPREHRSHFDNWLKSNVLAKQAKERREKEIESGFEIYCSNPECEVKEHGESILKKCVRCYFARYCSKDCQRSHWADHKRYCKRIVKILA